MHDNSENYRCSDHTVRFLIARKKQEISIHAMILNRHAILEQDGLDSTLYPLVNKTEKFFG